MNYCIHAALWNVHTLAEPTKSQLKKKLASEWFDALGVPEHAVGYYYHPGEYAEFLSIYRPARYALRRSKGALRSAARRLGKLVRDASSRAVQ